MKIVIFGLSLSSSWGNGHATTYRSLLKGLARRGHEVTFFERDVPWYANNRDMPQPDFCELHLYGDLEKIEDHRATIAAADAVIVGSFVPEGPDLIRRLAAIEPALLAFYDIDTPVTLEKLKRGDREYLSPELIPSFDLYLSFAGGKALKVLEERYGAEKTCALYCSVDTDLYHPVDEEKLWDLGYLGTYSPDRQQELESLLIEPARALPEKRFVVAGPQYPDDIAWPANVTHIPHVAPADHARFYSQLRFALNVTRRQMVELGHSPSVRMFEAAACATPIIGDHWAGIEDVFEPGRELLVAHSSADVIRTLSQFGADDAAAIGEAGRCRVMQQHSGEQRAGELEALLQDVTERPAVRNASAA
ncbi:glycosyltransferase [Afifella sp. JA880]|uniref:CgeB family protein n=1 Tax=Afifella sp. JA880 TaxID=2975280 RepID=UPI0021BB0FF7|nr:glycosyltransferase [Afifella sp. JA880]MCT8266286.1 glycosyltransferase [Afifella sp. JA880]